MVCIHCGKEINETAKFCSFCGKEVEPTAETNARVTVPVENVTGEKLAALHMSSIGCAVIMAIALMFPWISVELLGGVYQFSLSPWNAFDLSQELSNHMDVATFSIVALIMILTCIIGIILCIVFIVKMWKAQGDLKNSAHIDFGEVVMVIFAVLLVACSIFTLIIFDEDYNAAIEVSYNLTFYGAIVLACLNRFIILPKCKEGINKLNESGVLSKGSTHNDGSALTALSAEKERIALKDGWICSKCHNKNERLAQYCKNCGEYK